MNPTRRILKIFFILTILVVIMGIVQWLRLRKSNPGYAPGLLRSVGKSASTSSGATTSTTTSTPTPSGGWSRDLSSLPNATPADYPITQGKKFRQVAFIQASLNMSPLNSNLVIDGIFGPLTHQAAMADRFYKYNQGYSFLQYELGVKPREHKLREYARTTQQTNI
jgi:hypothetical protein